MVTLSDLINGMKLIGGLAYTYNRSNFRQSFDKSASNVVYSPSVVPLDINHAYLQKYSWT